MVQGKQRTQTESTNTKYVGFTNVKVVAVNPTRTELNKLLGKDDADDDKEIDYMSEDKDGNKRARVTFVLQSEELDKYFFHSVNITDKVRMNNNGDKTQYVNSVCGTAWAEDEDGLVSWFKSFEDRKTKEELGPKEYRPALVGEEELVTIIRSWLGRLDWFDTDTSVMVNTEKLFNDDFSELQGLVNGGDEGFDSEFTVLLGVRTDESDKTKQYQQVFGKAFLPSGFLNYIKKGFKFPSKGSTEMWNRFQKAAEGEYGFSSYFELAPAKEYDPKDDPMQTPDAGGVPANEDVTPTNNKY